MGNIKIIYHEVKPGIACPDGLAAAWVAKKKYENAEIIGCVYQAESLPKVNAGDTLVIVDFSFNKEILNSWAEIGCDIVVIDHHKSAWEMLQGFNKGILKFDMANCGAYLTWKYFFKDRPVPVFIEYVNDQDMWNWELPYSKEVASAFGWLKRSFSLFDYLEPLSREEFVNYMKEIGEPLVKRRQQVVKAIAAKHYWTIIDGHKVPVVCLNSTEGQYRSEVCEYLYNKYPDVPFTVCYRPERMSYWWGEKLKLHLDFRSKKGLNSFDCSALAKKFGGGGHRNASGATVYKERI
jgi:oligoribonuclease NrnB/cAMP/cGMP phosphodiesterase (DHH superfamily)